MGIVESAKHYQKASRLAGPAGYQASNKFDYETKPKNPADLIPPNNYGEFVGTAREPEWQCRNNGGQSFWEMPVQCIIAAAQKFSTAQWRSALEHEAERGNASRINDYADSPLLDFYSADDERMSQTLTSTTKKDKKKKKKQGESGIVPPNEYVEVKDDGYPRIDFTDTGLPDASQSGISSDDDWIPKGCKDALRRAGKTIEGFKRAVAAQPRIEELTSRATGNILAAIGIVETDFLNRNQKLGGAGRGVYQIDLSQNRNVTEAQANDFDFATKFVANAIQTNLNDIYKAMGNKDGDFTLLLAGAVRAHNAGRGGVVVKPNLGNGRSGPPQIGNILQKALDKNDISILDKGTAGGNDDYVTNVIGIYSNCFGR